MSDDLHRKLVAGGKVYRRKRITHGQVFADQNPPTRQEVNKGVWCKRCKARHPYNGSDRVRLVASYEKRGKAWVLLWSCPVSGDVVGEVVLGGKAVTEQEVIVKRTVSYKIRVPLSSYPNMTPEEAVKFEFDRPEVEIVEELIATLETGSGEAKFTSHVALSEEKEE